MLFSPYRKKSYGTYFSISILLLKLLLLKCYGEHYFIEGPIKESSTKLIIFKRNLFRSIISFPQQVEKM